MSVTEKTLNDLKSLVGQLRFDLTEAEKRLRDAHIEFHGLSLGMIVLYKGQEHKISSVSMMGYGRESKPWVKAKFKKKDGTWSEAERSLYDKWEFKK